MIDYDPHNWSDHLFDLRGTVIKKVAPRVGWITLWSILVLLISIQLPVQIPPTAHLMVGVALGLLLVFRTNASYDRYWEGRRQWGSIVNAARNLARSSVAWMNIETDSTREVRLWTVSFAYALMHRLREEHSFGDYFPKLPLGQAKECYATKNIPLAASIQISRAISKARAEGTITDQEQLLMDTQVANLVDALGACDRIHRTPVPFAYVVHLRRALIIYCVTLPHVLADGFGWTTPVVAMLVSFILLGIEEIGVEIEDPFGKDDNDLPLENFCKAIESDFCSVCQEPCEF
ncbi:MAG: bestrophin family protein [Pirellulales bacterium]